MPPKRNISIPPGILKVDATTQTDSENDPKIQEEAKPDNGSLTENGPESPVIGTVKDKLDETKYLKSSTLKNVFSKRIIALIIIILAWILYYANPNSNSDDDFSLFIKRLQSSYPGQKEHFWINIVASYETSIAEGRDPSIILLIHDETRAEKANAFIRDLVSGIDHLASKSNAYQIENSIFDLKSPDFAKWIKQDDSDQAKFLLDQKLESVYVPGRKIAMVKNLQDLPGKSALLFFTYGDDEHMCKFKGIILVLSVEVKSSEVQNYEQLVNNEREINSFARQHLTDLWKSQLDVDQEIKPLLSRISNNVIIIN